MRYSQRQNFVKCGPRSYNFVCNPYEYYSICIINIQPSFLWWCSPTVAISSTGAPHCKLHGSSVARPARARCSLRTPCRSSRSWNRWWPRSGWRTDRGPAGWGQWIAAVAEEVTTGRYNAIFSKVVIDAYMKYSYVFSMNVWFVFDTTSTRAKCFCSYIFVQLMQPCMIGEWGRNPWIEITDSILADHWLNPNPLSVYPYGDFHGETQKCMVHEVQNWKIHRKKWMITRYN